VRPALDALAHILLNAMALIVLLPLVFVIVLAGNACSALSAAARRHRLARHYGGDETALARDEWRAR